MTDDAIRYAEPATGKQWRVWWESDPVHVEFGRTFEEARDRLVAKRLKKRTNRKWRYGCPSGKRRYFDYASAYLQMQHIQRKLDEQGDGFVLKNIYKCPECSGWHLTRRKPLKSKEE